MKLWILGLFLVQMGCARPKYLTAEEVGGSTKEISPECVATFNASKLCVAWVWITKPTATQAGSLVFKTFRQSSFDQSPIETDLTQTPALILWMTSMGHGSSPTTVEKVDTGTYVAHDVFFIMPGDWDLKFQVLEQGQVTDEAVVPILFSF